MARDRWSLVQNDDMTWEVMDGHDTVEFGLRELDDATDYVRSQSSKRQSVLIVHYDGYEEQQWL